MANTQHTPGPWRAHRDQVSGLFGVQVAQCTSPTPSLDNMERRLANARLIAAAPELLEALRGIVNSSDYGSPTSRDDNGPLMRAAVAAIAKAVQS